MKSSEALAKLAEAARVAQHDDRIVRPATRFACVCLSWAPKWVEDKGHSYAAGYLAALYGSNRFIPEADKMHATIISALWAASELLEHGYHTTDAPADQIDDLLKSLAEMDETVPESADAA